jgi:putative sterol carrier protein
MLMNTVVRRPRRHWFADLKAEALAWWVRSASDQTLQSVMRSRRRVALVWQIFRTIRQRAAPDKGISAVVEFRITGRRDGGIDRYQLTLTGGRCTTSTRGTRRPALTLELEPVAFLRLVGGAASAPRLLITGKLKLRGDLMLALALPSVLRLPRRRPQAPLRKR